ncbi:lipopolysaccharide transport periplasmic protein LptA [Nitrospinota bacterium]
MAPAGADRAAAAPGPDKPTASPQAKRKEPIRIHSNRMEADNKKNVIVFIGKVSAVQGEMEIKSDRLEVYLQKRSKKSAGNQKSGKTREAPGQPGQGSVERLVARGNVLITQGKKKFASGDHLDYNELTGVAVLTGNPRAWEDNNQVVGTKIEIFFRDGRTIVHGSNRRRVSVTLFPEESNISRRPGTGRNER